jgi:hypothetical protein
VARKIVRGSNALGRYSLTFVIPALSALFVAFLILPWLSDLGLINFRISFNAFIWPLVLGMFWIEHRYDPRRAHSPPKDREH